MEYAIIWKAERGGESTFGPDNRLTAIHGYKVQVPPGKKAIYLLQPDHQLKEIALAEEDARHALAILGQDPRPSLAEDEVWREKVDHRLNVVEP